MAALCRGLRHGRDRGNRELPSGDGADKAASRTQKTAKYEEMCRRFLADQADFSEEKLKAANIIKRFKNEDRECCLKEVLSYIEHEL